MAYSDRPNAAPRGWSASRESVEVAFGELPVPPLLIDDDGEHVSHGKRGRCWRPTWRIERLGRTRQVLLSQLGNDPAHRRHAVGPQRQHLLQRRTDGAV